MQRVLSPFARAPAKNVLCLSIAPKQLWMNCILQIKFHLRIDLFQGWFLSIPLRLCYWAGDLILQGTFIYYLCHSYPEKGEQARYLTVLFYCLLCFLCLKNTFFFRFSQELHFPRIFELLLTSWTMCPSLSPQHYPITWQHPVLSHVVPDWHTCLSPAD